MRNDHILGDTQGNNGIGAGRNCVNCPIRVHSVGEHDHGSKAADSYPLQCLVLSWVHIAQGFHHDQIAVGHYFAQRLTDRIQINRNRLVGDVIDNLLHFVPVRTAMVQQRYPC